MNNKTLKQLNEEETEKVIDLVFFALNNVDDDYFHKAISNLGAYFSYHITKKSAEKIADALIELFGAIVDDADSIKERLLWNYGSIIRMGSLTTFCLILNGDDSKVRSFHDRLTSICGANSEDLSHSDICDFYSGKDHYRQKNNMIYSIKKTKDGEEIETLKAIFSVDNLIRYADILGISEPRYTLTYYHGYDNELKTIDKANKEQILKILMDEDLFNTDVKEAEKIFRSIRHSLHHLGLMEKEQTLLDRGFFIDDAGKLISNTNIDNLPTSADDLKEAMLLLIELLDNNMPTRYKNANILRYLLGMPFHFCIKQLGFAEGNTNGLILYGKAQTGKTSLAKIGLWFYLEEPYNYNASIDTLASLVRKLSTTTFYTLLDDSYGLLNNPAVQNTLKKGMYEMYSRTVSERDSRDVVEFMALSTPVATYNEYVPITDDGTDRRFLKIHFDKNNVISKDDSIRFKMIFKPFNKDSVLNKLCHIGIAFKEWIKPYLETNHEELNDIEALTLKFFIETLSELEMTYEPLTTKYKYENHLEDYGTIIRNEFNKQLLRSKLVYTNGVHTVNLINVAKSGYYSWLKYQPKNDKFVISVKDFISDCNKITNHSWSFEDLMSEVDITNYDVKQIKVNGKTIPKATFVEKKDLVQNVLNINSLIDDDFE